MLCALGRPKDDKLAAVAFDNACQIVAVVGGHVAGAAPATVIIARARPFVRPSRVALLANVVVAEPGHPDLPEISGIGSQSIIATRNEI